MREILFRGKRVDNGEWVEGYFCIKYFQEVPHDRFVIQYKTIEDAHKWTPKYMVAEVDPKSIGQYTGLTDKNGTKIFEGDIVKVQDDIWGSPFCNGITGKVVYEETEFFIEPKDPMEAQRLFNECAVYEVIGNIHDNPELLGGVDNG